MLDLAARTDKEALGFSIRPIGVQMGDFSMLLEVGRDAGPQRGG